MSSTPPNKIEALRIELDELQNPTDRPPKGTPKEAIQVVDRQRLLAAWESNVNTLRGVLEQMSIVQRTNALTRVLSLVTVLLNVVLLAVVISQLNTIESLVQQIENEVRVHYKLDLEVEKVINVQTQEPAQSH